MQLHWRRRCCDWQYTRMSFSAPLQQISSAEEFGMFFGSCLCIIGAICQASSSQHSALLAGRFILGFGAVIVQTSGTSYASEISNPAFRGVTAGLYPSCFSVGTMIVNFFGVWIEFLATSFACPVLTAFGIARRTISNGRDICLVTP